jgi:hypothetical protein
MNLKNLIPAILLAAFILNAILPAAAQADRESVFFDKVEILIPDANGKKVNERGVRLRFLQNEMQIETTSDQKIFKTFKYAEIKDAEYSYTKNPRWKTGVGLGAASILFPPLLLIAIPIGFSKHRRHWLTIRTGDDYAVLKLSKSNRKLILPAFETKSGVNVSGIGDDK